MDSSIKPPGAPSVGAVSLPDDVQEPLGSASSPVAIQQGSLFNVNTMEKGLKHPGGKYSGQIQGAGVKAALGADVGGLSDATSTSVSGSDALENPSDPRQVPAAAEPFLGLIAQLLQQYAPQVYGPAIDSDSSSLNGASVDDELSSGSIEPDADTSSLSDVGGYSYQEVDPSSEEIWSSGGPSASDFRQGATGDCYFLSSLSAVAQKDPDFLANNIKETGTDPQTGAKTYDVTMFYHGQPETIPVDDRFLSDTQGKAVYAQTLQDGSKTEIGAALYEKAYAKLVDEHPDLAQGTGSDTGYTRIGDGSNGSAGALEAITGQSSTDYNVTDGPESAWAGYDTDGNLTGASKNISGLLSAANSGTYVTAGSLTGASLSHKPGYDKTDGKVHYADGSTVGYDDKTGALSLDKPDGSSVNIVASHMYTVMGTDSATGNVILRNPWGTNPDPTQAIDPDSSYQNGKPSENGVFEVSQDDFKKMYDEVSVGTPANENAAAASAPLSSPGALDGRTYLRA